MFHNDDIRRWLDHESIEFVHVDDSKIVSCVAQAIDAGAVVGWFRGRAEFGPRALGRRSILADPRRSETVRRLNTHVKRREGFRPFAPMVPEELSQDWFEIDRPSPYMLFTAQVRDAQREEEESREASLSDRLSAVRSPLPACTHVDGSARLQTVTREQNPLIHDLLHTFGKLTGVPILVNTSFNGPAEPMVRTPAEALDCARRAGLDLLVLENCIVTRGSL